MKLFRNLKPKKADPQELLLAAPRAPPIQLPPDGFDGLPPSSLQPIIEWPVPELAATQTSFANESGSRRGAKPVISINHSSPSRRASDDSMKVHYGDDPRVPETEDKSGRLRARSINVHREPPLLSSSSSQASSNASMRVLVGDTSYRPPLPSPLSRASSDASMRVHLGDTRSKLGIPELGTELAPDYIDVMHEPPPEYSTLYLQRDIGWLPTGSGQTSPDNENRGGDSMQSPNTERLESGVSRPSRSQRTVHSRFAPGRDGLVEEEGGDGGTDDQMEFTSANQIEWMPSLEILMTNHTPLNLSGQVIIPNRINPAHGGLADVYAGLWNNRMVAVKVLRIRKSRRADADLEASNERRIAREMHVWAALKHPNISEFLGYSIDFGDYPSMISTWCKRGTASEYLDQQQRPVNERVRLAQDVSDGLEFLHLLKIVHGDLKPSNVLIDEACVARLCDFGLVRLVDWEGPAGMTTTSPYMGTERYKAPELFISTDNRHPVATFDGDIYSLGCIILEFIEQVYPFQRFRRNHELRNAIMDGYSPALRSEATASLLGGKNTLWDLLEACWDEALRRPIVSVVVEALGSLAR